MQRPKALCYRRLNSVVRKDWEILAWYRPGTSDERVLTEVLDKKCYRKAKLGFDVEQGEKWLDLGANIGAFALYCRIRGAGGICYEPDPACFNVLRRNALGFLCHNYAVSVNTDDAELPLYTSPDADTHTRGTLLPQRQRGAMHTVMVKNHAAWNLKSQVFDGVKMDIEGSEFDILDGDYLPRCEKLVFEYHTSRDASTVRLGKRLDYLRRKFKEVSYPAELDRLVEAGEGKPFADRLIFCKGWKGEGRPLARAPRSARPSQAAPLVTASRRPSARRP